MDSFESWNEFRRNENPKACKLVCCECGKPAQGNVTCEDGDICDACHKEMAATPKQVVNTYDGPQKLNNVVDVWRASQTTLRGGFKPRRHC